MKIISGAQTGADIAGLKIAKKHGLETGGWIPKGFLTRDGFKPKYAKLYGMTETKSSAYPERTKLNVKDSDCTIWFGEDRYSRGKICTFKNIKSLGKPSVDINIDKPVSVKKLRNWIVKNDFEIINIAGNSETLTNNMELRVSEYLNKLFDELFEDE